MTKGKQMPGTAAGPLAGVRILDFTRVLAGPHATRMLSDMGAEVIKVEPPDGDLTRFTFPKIGSLATYFIQQNVGKLNISLDLRKPKAVEILRDLADKCDVVVENFRMGVLESLGLGPDTLMARNPGLIYASVNGYGRTGPWASRRAYAPVVGAEAGYTVSQAEGRGGEYKNDFHAHGDAYTALELASAILAGLYQRERCGSGQHIEVTLAETMLYVNEHVHNALFTGPVDPNWVRSFGGADYPIVSLADGSRAIIAAHPAERYTFNAYTEVMKAPWLRDDERFVTPADRLSNMDSLVGEIAKWAYTVANVDELERDFAAHRIAVGALRSVAEIAESEWARERRAFAEVSDRNGGVIRIPNPPWRFGAASAQIRGEVRYPGEDNRAVLSDLLGLTDDRINQLKRDGVLVDRLPTRAQ